MLFSFSSGVEEFFVKFPSRASKLLNKEAVSSFILRYPGLKYLKDVVIPKDAKRGYFEGFDGRYVKCDSEHLMLAGYLQNGESVIMKRANVLWRNKLIKENIFFNFSLFFTIGFHFSINNC